VLAPGPAANRQQAGRIDIRSKGELRKWQKKTQEQEDSIQPSPCPSLTLLHASPHISLLEKMLGSSLKLAGPQNRGRGRAIKLTRNAHKPGQEELIGGN
jgi:hypothetical protein